MKGSRYFRRDLAKVLGPSLSRQRGENLFPGPLRTSGRLALLEASSGRQSKGNLPLLTRFNEGLVTFVSAAAGGNSPPWAATPQQLYSPSGRLTHSPG